MHDSPCCSVLYSNPESPAYLNNIMLQSRRYVYECAKETYAISMKTHLVDIYSFDLSKFSLAYVTLSSGSFSQCTFQISLTEGDLIDFLNYLYAILLLCKA